VQIKIDRQLKIRVAAWLSVMVLTALLTISIARISGSKHSNKPSTKQTSTSEAIKPELRNNVSSQSQQSSLIVSIYLSKAHEIARVPLEQYVAGVVAAEMPVSFELEALKAQAMTARTYIVRRIVNRDFSGMTVNNAEVTDTVAHQAYLTEAQLKKSWGQESFKTNMAKINQAVNDTQGLIITYNNKPINATYFSTSNGYTENSEDYWGVTEPYLRSVSSPWDQKFSPKFSTTIQMTLKQFSTKLGLKNSKASTNAIPASLSITNHMNVQLSQGHRILQMNILGKSFTGKEIRERLALPSSSFTWKKNGDYIDITVLGSGHGVGMSQWGANGMAMEGKLAQEIIKHYYKGIEIQSVMKFTSTAPF
jgi:stage II sporulation protein D